MKLSVIIPAYRLASYIHECVLSVLAQRTDFEFEVLVGNDASPDDTLAALAPLGAYPQLRVLDNPRNLGLVGTMARLLSEARGDYIAYLDGDDVALPGKLQAQADYLDSHPGCAICYHESQVFDSASGTLGKLYSRDYYNAAYVPAVADLSHLIRYGTFLQASSVMIRRHPHLLDALDHGCRIICDYPWHMANAFHGHGSIDRIDQVLGRYRMHGASFGAQTSRNGERRLEVTAELERACRRALVWGVDPRVVAQGVSHARFAAALYFLRAGDDALFTRLIESAECDGWYFDERHHFASKNSRQPDLVRHHMGWRSDG